MCQVLLVRPAAALPWLLLFVAGSAEFTLHWADCCFQNVSICVEKAGMCRSLAHFVVNANTAPDAVIRGGAKCYLDDPNYAFAGGVAVSEAKPDVEHNTQSINWGYDAVVPYTEMPNMSQNICARMWVENVNTQEFNWTGLHCLSLSTVMRNSTGDVSDVMPSYFDSEHSQAIVVSNALGLRRLLMHVDVRVAAPNVVDIIKGKASCSFGSLTDMAPCGSVVFEQQIQNTNINTKSLPTQVFQFVHNMALGHADPIPTQACFRLSFNLVDYPDSPTTYIANCMNVMVNEVLDSESVAADGSLI